MKKINIEMLVEKVLDYLSQLPDGTEISTYEALIQACETAQQKPNADVIEDLNWFALHIQVCRKADTYRLKLDDSKYHDMTIGLPHCIPYVVTHK